jgi:diphosphomevalonate decarboxylase
VASSAAGFAALTLALDDFFGWSLSARELSILARMGSGSACRSIYHGFVLWHAGNAIGGMDSFAEPLPCSWPDLRVGLILLSEKTKPVGSRAAMKRTKETSSLYTAWPAKVQTDIESLQEALDTMDFDQLGQTAESNALAMHATMLDAWPPILYWQPETVDILHRVQSLRENGIPVYCTIDAGPNVKVLFEKQHGDSVLHALGDMQVVAPFGNETEYAE